MSVSPETKRQSRIDAFFAGLAPVLRMAEAAERRLAQEIAHRYDPIALFRPDELALSRIIADLLNPAGAHGQGALFFELFLKTCLENPIPQEWTRGTVAVSLEPTISVPRDDLSSDTIGGEDRRMDILVEMQSGNFAIGIENKPYSEEHNNQLDAYFEWMKKQYGDNFILLYLLGSYDDVSRREDHQFQNENRRFRIIPYHANEGEVSLYNWILKGAAQARPEHVRWFLKALARWIEREPRFSTAHGETENG